MAAQQTGDLVLASALNVPASASPTYLPGQPGVIRGGVQLLLSVAFNGSLTSVQWSLEWYLASAEKWFPVYDANQTLNEATYTSAKTDRWTMVGNNRQRQGCKSLPQVGDSWRLALLSTGGVSDSADWTIVARPFQVQRDHFTN